MVTPNPGPKMHRFGSALWEKSQWPIKDFSEFGPVANRKKAQKLELKCGAVHLTLRLSSLSVALCFSIRNTHRRHVTYTSRFIVIRFSLWVFPLRYPQLLFIQSPNSFFFHKEPAGIGDMEIPNERKQATLRLLTICSFPFLFHWLYFRAQILPLLREGNKERKRKEFRRRAPSSGSSLLSVCCSASFTVESGSRHKSCADVNVIRHVLKAGRASDDCKVLTDFLATDWTVLTKTKKRFSDQTH